MTRYLLNDPSPSSVAQLPRLLDKGNEVLISKETLDTDQFMAVQTELLTNNEIASLRRTEYQKDEINIKDITYVRYVRANYKMDEHDQFEGMHPESHYGEENDIPGMYEFEKKERLDPDDISLYSPLSNKSNFKPR